MAIALADVIHIGSNLLGSHPTGVTVTLGVGLWVTAVGTLVAGFAAAVRR